MALSFETRCSLSLSSFIKRVKGLSDDQQNIIKRTGFGYLLEMHNQTLSKNLLLELMERWCCKKKVFKLRPGELKISLMDVALILGLRVTGKSVVIDEYLPFTDLEKEYGATIQKRCIQISYLERRLESLKTAATEDFARSFLLYTFGALLFPNGHGTVDSRYLSFLKDLDRVTEFAWGKAVRQYLYDWMDKLKKEAKLQNMGSCLIFLQLWSFEHIDIARPTLLESSLTFPRANRWKNCSSRRRDWLATKFEELQGNQIVWRLQLTSEESTRDIIRDLLEMRDETAELSSTLEYPMSDAADMDDDIRDVIPAVEEEVIVLEDSEVLIIEDSLELQEDEREILSTSRYAFKHKILQEDKMEIPSTSKYASKSQMVEEDKTEVLATLKYSYRSEKQKDNIDTLSTAEYASCSDAVQEDCMEILSTATYAPRNEDVHGANMGILSISKYVSWNAEAQEDNMENLSLPNYASTNEEVQQADMQNLSTLQGVSPNDSAGGARRQSGESVYITVQEDDMEMLSTSDYASRNEEVQGENTETPSISNYVSWNEEAPDDNTESLLKSNHASRNEEVQEDNREELCTLRCVHTNDSAGYEDKRALEEQIVELKEENAMLREENIILRNRLVSSGSLVDRFERILLDEDVH